MPSTFRRFSQQKKTKKWAEGDTPPLTFLSLQPPHRVFIVLLSADKGPYFRAIIPFDGYLCLWMGV